MKITQHAYQRAKQRCGLKKKALDHLLPIAMEKGLKHSECTGGLNKWVTSVYLSFGNGNNMRVYGEYLFICEGEKLITIYFVPNHLKKLVKKLIDKKIKKRR